MKRISDLLKLSSHQKSSAYQPVLDKLVVKMREKGYKEIMISRLNHRIKKLNENKVVGIEPFLYKLLDRVSDKQEYLDILMEGRFALILTRNGFSQIHIEFSNQGPDIEAKYKGSTVYFEITRKRPDEQDEEWENPEAAFVESASVGNVMRKIYSKMHQLINNEINIVVIWSDSIGFGEPEVKAAFEYVRSSINSDPNKYICLSGVLLTEGGGVDIATMQQFYLYKNNSARVLIPKKLALILEQLSERDSRKMRKEITDLEKSLKKLKNS